MFKNYKIYFFWIVAAMLCTVGCTQKHRSEKKIPRMELDVTQAEHILQLPLECIQIEYPNKLGQVLGSDADLRSPRELRPIFYGCFDWHSSVHGYWSIVKVLKMYPQLDANGDIMNLLDELITPENAEVELAFFKDKNNLNFERTYGWAWFLKLQAELKTWDDERAVKWYNTLQPLADLFVEKMNTYLPKLVYPIRSGQHDNTAFGLSLMLDYAKTVGDESFVTLIKEHAVRLFSNDVNCNINFEPSGTDFLSPCLEEALLMGSVLEKNKYKVWLEKFLPQITKSDFDLAPGVVKDRSDGHLVHLDGLNYSRANCLYNISLLLPELDHLQDIAAKHIEFSLPHLQNDDYMGSHWLGTFALYSLTHRVD